MRYNLGTHQGQEMCFFHGRVKSEISCFKFLSQANLDEQTEHVKVECNLANS